MSSIVFASSLVISGISPITVVLVWFEFIIVIDILVWGAANLTFIFDKDVKLSGSNFCPYLLRNGNSLTLVLPDLCSNSICVVILYLL